MARTISLLILSAAWPLAAQVSEKEEPMDLARGLALKADMAKPGAPLAEAAKTQVGSRDFSLAMTVPIPDPLRETVLAAQIDDSQGWRLLVTADGALRIEARVKSKADPFAIATTPGAVTAGSTHHVAVNIQRDAAKPNAGIWLDGIELASGIVPPADLTATQPLSVANGAQKIHLYQRSLSRPEMLALWLDAAGTGKPVAKHPAPPADGPRFVPQQDETIALIGGTEAVALAESGELEAILLLSFPETRFHFRSLAWEGDTVFHQDRPMNFGDLPQQLRRVHAGTVIMIFGRQECLDLGRNGLKDFEAALERLLLQVKAHTENVIIASPPRFQHAPELAGRPSSSDDVLQALDSCYEIMERLADKHRVLYVKSHMPVFLDGPPRSSDGVTLTAFGVEEFAKSFGHDLGLYQYNKLEVKSVGKVLDALRAKNRLWHDYWRPSNWAFLHGDRTQQPSSRDPVNPQLRFFPAEQEQYLPLIKEAEERTFKLVEETTKKLP